jgi:hypothetical protein
MKITKTYQVRDLDWFLSLAGNGCVWSYLYIGYYYLTAIGLTPGSSSTVHIYTQTVHRWHPVAAVQYTFTHKQYTEQHNETEYMEQRIHNNKNT